VEWDTPIPDESSPKNSPGGIALLPIVRVLRCISGISRLYAFEKEGDMPDLATSISLSRPQCNHPFGETEPIAGKMRPLSSRSNLSTIPGKVPNKLTQEQMVILLSKITD
jgi:hypothetical protein